MFRPSDLQLVLLTTAAQRGDGSLLPPPETIGGQAVRIRRSIPPLIKNGLVSESVVTAIGLAWREDGDTHYGAFITDAGREAIGAEPLQGSDEENVADVKAASPTEPKASTKTGMVLDMLRRDDGATLEELATATGWLPHTTRAALTGLRKKGHHIARGKRGETTCYSLKVAA
ncbi:DUF3489 domain-containing protein [Sphingomonas sp. AP4-R1]|uniref:DUF3489 domain-containing protein n=1 Tax=Sphingomonas sp. AP4-R1 TaxID=2735134 RepID=UPI0014936CD1|nr:DUF3489 domain-containing protein [Sphingomonas sp. AP4-R1]QJU59994.1 DUF3489 domain-containing protein [Sphingomonas sp. AP4-R1]